ncbi:MAG: hypothetical protein ACYSTL_03650 [Planctomycetota bacterium]|jgi:hypothetical protein
MLSFNLFATGILLVFYLYLLVHPEHVKRCMFAMIGAAGLLVALFSGFFIPWLGSNWANVLVGLLSTIGSLIAFVSAFLACCSGKVAGGECQVPEAAKSKPPADK